MLNNYWNELFPLALKCGMTPTQFWDDEPRLIHSYLIKHQLEADDINYRSWLFGLYVYDAFAVVLSNAFSKDSKAKYFEKPIEEMNATFKPKVEATYREKVNFWAKLGKKGGKNGKQ